MKDDIKNDVSYLLGRMDGKLDLLLTRQDNHEERISVLEDKENQRTGVIKTLGIAAGIVGAGVSAAVNYLMGSN